MKVLVRFPDNSLRNVEVTQMRVDSISGGYWPDVKGMFPDFIVLESLGPDADGCHYHLIERPR